MTAHVERPVAIIRSQEVHNPRVTRAVFVPVACIWLMGECPPVHLEMCGRRQASPMASSAKWRLGMDGGGPARHTRC